MAYIYNSRTGYAMNTALMPIPGQVQIALKSGTGWHGPFNTRAEVDKYYNDNKAKNPGWKAPTDYFGGIDNLPDAAEDQAGAVANAAKGAIGLSDDELRAWLIRIGEILLGIVLVGVGIAKLTGTTNAVAKIVKAKIP